MPICKVKGEILVILRALEAFAAGANSKCENRVDPPREKLLNLCKPQHATDWIRIVQHVSTGNAKIAEALAAMEGAGAPSEKVLVCFAKTRGDAQNMFLRIQAIHAPYPHTVLSVRQWPRKQKYQ